MFNESFADSWVQRYGATPEKQVSELASFLRHRSVRKYSSEPIDDEVLCALIGSAQSASTSSNLQLYSIISVRDRDRRLKIAELCGDQAQVKSAPVFLAFFADHARIRDAGKLVDEPCLGLDYNEFFTMAVIDASLAAERLACAAEFLGIGVCYIGALRNDPYGVQDFFELPKHVVGLFGMCLGWPDESFRAEIKPRLSQENVWHEETYKKVPVQEFDQRMAEFYESYSKKPDGTWSKRSARRVSEDQLTGREALKPFIIGNDMDVR